MASRSEDDRRRILVVEDDPDSRVMLATLLSVSGFRVVTAANGQEALTAARTHSPSLILLDLMMPIMGGAEFRQAQRQQPDIADTPVIVLSAQHGADEIARRMGACALLPKPIEVEQLFAAIEAHARPCGKP
jgi:CheY-like chemotaxis protein